MSQPTPLPDTPYVCGREGDGYSADRLLPEQAYDEYQMLAYGKAEYERGLEDAARTATTAQPSQPQDERELFEDAFPCSKAFKGNTQTGYFEPWSLAWTSWQEARKQPLSSWTDHELSVINDIAAMANDPTESFWPNILAVAALRMLEQSRKVTP